METVCLCPKCNTNTMKLICFGLQGIGPLVNGMPINAPATTSSTYKCETCNWQETKYEPWSPTDGLNNRKNKNMEDDYQYTVTTPQGKKFYYTKASWNVAYFCLWVSGALFGLGVGYFLFG